MGRGGEGGGGQGQGGGGEGDAALGEGVEHEETRFRQCMAPVAVVTKVVPMLAAGWSYFGPFSGVGECAGGSGGRRGEKGKGWG